MCDVENKCNVENAIWKKKKSNVKIMSILEFVWNYEKYFQKNEFHSESFFKNKTIFIIRCLAENYK